MWYLDVFLWDLAIYIVIDRYAEAYDGIGTGWEYIGVISGGV